MNDDEYINKTISNLITLTLLGIVSLTSTIYAIFN